MDNRFKVLIADDERMNIQMISSALKDDYDIFTAQNGCDAVSQIKEHLPDLVLLDVMMPDLNGFDVCSAIKENALYVDIPIIFLTALDTLEGEHRGLDVGGIDYLIKPVNFELLKLRVRNHLELKKRNGIIREQLKVISAQKEELERSLERVKHLEGIIPICMYCKSIRTDANSWQLLEEYITEHTDALLSHGVCSACLKRYLPDSDGTEPK